MRYEHYLAHIAWDGRKQTVLEHLEGTAKLCAGFALAFGAEEQGRLAGMAHDLGKYSIEFQRRLQESGARADHSTAGAAVCCKMGQTCAAFAVAGHHTGLPDGGGRGDREDEPTFSGRMRRAKLGKLPVCDAWQEELRLVPAEFPDFSSQSETMFFYPNALLLPGRRGFSGHGDLYGGGGTGPGRRGRD